MSPTEIVLDYVHNRYVRDVAAAPRRTSYCEYFYVRNVQVSVLGEGDINLSVRPHF
jgi:hypothetical protein